MMIVNQPIVQGFTVSATFTCSCEQKQIMVVALSRGLLFGCASCKQWYRVEGFALEDGVLSVALAKVLVKPREMIHG